MARSLRGSVGAFCVRHEVLRDSVSAAHFT